MPVLGHKQPQRTVLPSTKHLPSDEQGWVEIDPNITGEVVLSAAHADGNNMQYTIALLSKAILAWNYTDEAGKPAAITEATVKLLPMKDLKHLEDLVMNTIESEGGLDEGEKKE